MAEINYIRLVQLDKEGNPVEDKNGNFKFDTYFTSNFIPYRKTYEATEIMEGKNNEGKELSEKDMVDRMLDFLIDIYNNQFTRDDLLDRLHSPNANDEIRAQVEFVAAGQMDEERKKQLAKMI
ncbi:phage tail assembly chaperone G [Staphylococcus carnosus]|uniref:phage tail assembly chaperone G n=1 Tax=Staphylococcus carnosus TaxID=1281 RepID=UPI00081A4096|nr:hypothetical protein [Staphylococcus carnosus]ANZ33072.1 hypothetical protein BEK99_04325 [Staphylococcus carnosus]UTB85211.1 hypothetical protein A2I66_05930 [Staphylococcus carnosus]